MRKAGRVLLVALLAAACAAPHDEVTVSAAASLTDAFTAMADEFEKRHGIEVVLNFGPSSGLRDQILEGAPVDVFASANTANMDAVAGELAGEPSTFARNELVIAVPAGNPAGVTGLGDLAREELLVGLCAAAVPCGDYARAALAAAGVTLSIDSDEPDVRSLLTKIEEGELDVGIVYVSDLVGRASVFGVGIPDEHNVAADYPIGVLAHAPHPVAARSFVDFVLSEEGRRILADYGLAAP